MSETKGTLRWSQCLCEVTPVWSCALKSDKQEQKVSEACQHFSLPNSKASSLFCLSSRHHPLPTRRHTLLWGDSLLSSPAACENWPRGLKEEVGKRGGGSSYWEKKKPKNLPTCSEPSFPGSSRCFTICWDHNELSKRPPGGFPTDCSKPAKVLQQGNGPSWKLKLAKDFRISAKMIYWVLNLLPTMRNLITVGSQKELHKFKGWVRHIKLSVRYFLRLCGSRDNNRAHHIQSSASCLLTSLKVCGSSWVYIITPTDTFLGLFIHVSLLWR